MYLTSTFEWFKERAPARLRRSILKKEKDRTMKNFSGVTLAAFLFSLIAVSALGQGQPNYAITPSIKPTRLPASTLAVPVTLCLTNSGINNSEPIPVAALQTFNIDVQLGSVVSASAIRVTDPIPVQPTANPTTAADWNLTQGLGNPNKIFFNFTAATTKDFPAGTMICADVTINTGTAAEARARFFGTLTTSTGNVPFVPMATF